MAGSVVDLPPQVRGDFEVYINGVHQVRGQDFEVRDRELHFAAQLAQEGRLGFWRWFRGAWGIGTYRAHHSVDVRYELDGRPMLAEGLEPRPGDDASGGPSS